MTHVFKGLRSVWSLGASLIASGLVAGCGSPTSARVEQAEVLEESGACELRDYLLSAGLSIPSKQVFALILYCGENGIADLNNPKSIERFDLNPDKIDFADPFFENYGFPLIVSYDYRLHSGKFIPSEKRILVEMVYCAQKTGNELRLFDKSYAELKARYAQYSVVVESRKDDILCNIPGSMPFD